MPAEKPKPENLLLNLACNILIPTVILMRFSGEKTLGPMWGLVAALAFPLGYGIWDFSVRRKTNFISVIGFLSVLLSGGLGLMKVGGMGFAIKDGTIPLVIGFAVIVSLKTKRPLVRSLLYNDQVIDVAKVDRALDERNAHPAFERLLVKASYALALSFVASAVLNFSLARYLLRSPAGTPAFNEELGKMHFWNWPVVLIPSMLMMMAILWWLLSGIKRLTGMEMDDVFHQEPEKEKAKS